MIWQESTRWIKQHVRLLAYVGSAGFISAWTILRFFTQRTIFDLVGQQVLAQQLLHDGIAGASIGITNYIPKLLFMYVPLHILPGSPRTKLLLLTITVNVATIILLGIVLEKILQKFGVKAGIFLWVGLLWLSAIAGSVFWVEFTNSRNLEVVGGVFLLYQGICYLEHPGWKRLVAISLFATGLFFADTLQVYMTAIPLILYGTTLAIRSHTFRTISSLGAGLAAAYVGSKVVFAVCIWLFSVHFIQNGGGTATLPLHSLAHGAVSSFSAFVHLYSGAADAGKLRELYNLAFLAGVITLCIYTAWQKILPKRLLLLVGYILVVNELVYIISGQAQNITTERYLIMTAPALVLLLGSMQANWKNLRIAGLVSVAILLTVNSLFLTKTLAASSGNRFSQDTHLTSIAHYIQHNPKTLPYASMDTAIPMSYLYGSDMAAPLPLSCQGLSILKNNTFYSKTTYRRREKTAYQMVAIILDGGAITNAPNTCRQSDIIGQLGKPMATTVSDDGSIILLYNTKIVHKLHY